MIKDFFNSFFKKNKTTEQTETSSNKVSNESNLDAIEDNGTSKKQQTRKKMYILITSIAVTLLIINFVSEKKTPVTKISNENPKVELAANSIKPDKMWLTHLEDKIREIEVNFEEKLKTKDEALANLEKKRDEEIREENEQLKAQIAFAKAELQSASLELNRAVGVQLEMNAKEPPLEISNTTSKHLGSNTDYDEPKDSKYYIPETTYVTGYLLGGLAVSTALSAPDSNTTPVVMRITNRGNLPRNFSTDIETCKILGSSYGDLSSERAIIRLEKMICIDPETELVTTTSIAGTLYGDDGASGIKGRVVSTGSKHLNNAMIGGIISGLSQSAKGQENMSITSLGAISTKKQTTVDMLQRGAFQGASNAAEKVADYYLKLAESISPILVVDAGVRVQAMFLKGFHIGELKTHAKIAKERFENKKQYIEPEAAQKQYDKITLNEGSYSDQ